MNVSGIRSQQGSPRVRRRGALRAHDKFARHAKVNGECAVGTEGPQENLSFSFPSVFRRSGEGCVEVFFLFRGEQGPVPDLEAKRNVLGCPSGQVFTAEFDFGQFWHV